MKTNELRVKVTLKEDMLGTASADPDIYASYIASKSPNPEQAVSEEVKTLPDDEQITENETESKTKPLLFFIGIRKLENLSFMII